MEQYLDTLKTIQEKETYKAAARENMPGTLSRFGHQFRHDLADGFPLLTTKKMYWRGVTTELIWFLRGDTNIKYLVDNGVKIWNEDAYNYYTKMIAKNDNKEITPLSFETFCEIIKTHTLAELEEEYSNNDYTLGDCGYQYGRVWRAWEKYEYKLDSLLHSGFEPVPIDQLQNVIDSLMTNPMSRRHIVTAWDPAHDQDLALTWCHAMFQFNCRPLSHEEKIKWAMNNLDLEMENLAIIEVTCDPKQTPQYYLDCQLYQRSCDSFLGAPFNIASYALLTHLIAQMVDMIPGELIISYGDVHIYDNHKEAVATQLERTPTKLPTLKMMDHIPGLINNWHQQLRPCEDLQAFFDCLRPKDFILDNYDPQPSIKAELSTGMAK